MVRVGAPIVTHRASPHSGLTPSISRKFISDCVWLPQTPGFSSVSALPSFAEAAVGRRNTSRLRAVSREVTSGASSAGKETSRF